VGERSEDLVAAAKTLLKANGFVVLREKSYRQAQERQRVAEALREAADSDREAHYEWMRREVFPEERRLRDRCMFLYGAARAHGATVEELRNDPDSERNEASRG